MIRLQYEELQALDVSLQTPPALSLAVWCTHLAKPGHADAKRVARHSAHAQSHCLMQRLSGGCTKQCNELAAPPAMACGGHFSVSYVTVCAVCSHLLFHMHCCSWANAMPKRSCI